MEMKNYKGDTFLHAAVRSQNIELIKELLNDGADLDAQNNEKHTPLSLACAGSSDAVIDELTGWALKTDKEYELTFHFLRAEGFLVFDGKLQELDWALSMRNKTEDTPLHRTAKPEESDKRVILALLEKNAYINAKDNSGYSDLHIACLKNNNPAVMSLLQMGVNPDIRSNSGNTAFHWAVCSENGLRTVQILLHSGASFDIKNNDGETVYDWIVRLCRFSKRRIKYLEIKWEIERHALKLKVAGLRWVNVDFDDTYTLLSVVYRPTAGLTAKCVQELEKMKNVELNGKQLYFLILKQRYAYKMMNQETVKSFQEYIDSPRLSKKFPKYFKILKNLSKKSTDFYQLRQLPLLSLSNLVKPHNKNMPYEVIEEIIKYLDNYDLCEVIKSGLYFVSPNLASVWCKYLPEVIREDRLDHFLTHLELEELLKTDLVVLPRENLLSIS